MKYINYIYIHFSPPLSVMAMKFSYAFMFSIYNFCTNYLQRLGQGFLMLKLFNFGMHSNWNWFPNSKIPNVFLNFNSNI